MPKKAEGQNDLIHFLFIVSVLTIIDYGTERQQIKSTEINQYRICLLSKEVVSFPIVTMTFFG